MEDQNIQIRIVQKIEEFLALQNEWESLCNELGKQVTVFASFTWYETWWRYYGSVAELFLLTMWEKGRLVGIAPLMRKKINLHGLPVKIICFLENHQSRHNDFIVLPYFRKIFFQRVFQHIKQNSDLWDVIILRFLPTSSPQYTDLLGTLNKDKKSWQQVRTWTDSPYLLPNGSWHDYLASRSLRTRKNLRNIHNRMNRAGQSMILNIKNWEDFSKIKEDFFNIAKESWTEKIGDSIASPVNRDFFETLICHAAEKGWLSIWVLQLNGKLIAVELHLRAFGKEHALRSHYLPEFSSLSPGTFLEMKILENIFSENEKVDYYDFGGGFETYKMKWTANSVPHNSIFIFNKNIYSRFIKFYVGGFNYLKNYARNREIRWPPEDLQWFIKILFNLKQR